MFPFSNKNKRGWWKQRFVRFLSHIMHYRKYSKQKQGYFSHFLRILFVSIITLFIRFGRWAKNTVRKREYDPIVQYLNACILYWYSHFRTKPKLRTSIKQDRLLPFLLRTFIRILFEQKMVHALQKRRQLRCTFCIFVWTKYSCF